MNNCMKLTTLGLVSALMLAIAAPSPAHAGTLSIYNRDCTKFAGFKRHKRVTVHVDGPPGCTDTKVNVAIGSTRTINLVQTTDKARSGAFIIKVKEYECTYTHEASGTVGGKQNIHGKQNSKVTCEKDRGGVCQCTKD